MVFPVVALSWRQAPDAALAGPLKSRIRAATVRLRLAPPPPSVLNWLAHS